MPKEASDLWEALADFDSDSRQALFAHGVSLVSDPAPRNEEAVLTASAPDEAAPKRLRVEAPRVTRLSRKALAGIGVMASVGLGGALIYALQTRDGAGPREELYSTENRSTADGMAGLPRDYSGVPRLRPPLPGDLGRPILMPRIGGSRCLPPA